MCKGIAVFLMILCLMFLCPSVLAANEKIVKTPEQKVSILVLHSYNQADMRVNEINMGLDKVFSEHGFLVSEMRYEYLDVLNGGGPEYRKLFTENFIKRYSKKNRPDLVIVAGDLALDFFKGIHDKIHKDVPVVFCGLSDFNSSMLPKNPCTGIVQDVDVKKTVEMIKKLQPQVRHLVLVADELDPVTRAKTIEIKRRLEVFAPNYNIEYWVNVPLEEMVGRVSSLSPDTAMLLGNYTQDINRQIYSPTHVIRMLESRSAVPIYSFWDYIVAAGATGGVVVSPELQGAMAGKLAVEILYGANARDIKIRDNVPCESMVNWKQIEKFGLDIDTLSPKPRILNYVSNFFDIFGHYIWLAVVVIGSETFIIFLLVLQHYKRKASDRKLRQSQSLLRMVINHVPNGLLTIDGDGNIILVNDSLARFLGYPREAIQGRNIEKIKQDSPQLASKLKTNLKLSGYENQIVHLTDFLIPGHNMPNKWVNITHNPFKAGQQDASLIVLEDTTERKLERELQKESHKLRGDILENMPDAILLLDRELRIQWVNDTATRFFRRKPEEMIGKKCFDCKFYRDEPCPNCPALVALNTREIGVMDREDPETGRFWHVRVVPILSEHDEVLGLIEIVQDVTTEVEANAEEDKKLEMLNTIFHALPAGVVIIDRNKKVLRANRCALDMMKIDTEDQLVGQVCNSRFCISQAGQCPVLDLGQHVDNSERVLLTAEGETLPILKTVTPFTLMGEEVLIEVFVDITEYKEKIQHDVQEEKLELVGQVAGGIAPDFNNHLMAIMGYASMLDVELTDPTLLEYVKAIQIAAKQSSDITQKLLAFSRKGKLISTKVDMHLLIQDVIEDISKTLPDNILIETQLSDKHLAISGDSAELHNAIFNVAANARDAMPDGGKLLFVSGVKHLDPDSTLRQTHEVPTGDYFKLSVIDTGYGMSKEVKSHIFEPFYSTKPGGAGTGMSLTVVMGVVKGHNGFVEIKSTEGLGTCFDIYMLLSDEDKSEPEKEKHKNVEVENSTILIISPELIARKMLSKALKEKGHKIFAAKNGQQGLDCFERERKKIDLVLLSMETESPDARKIFEKLMILKDGVKVIIMTGKALDEDMQFIINNGGAGFIYLPCTEARLIRTVEEILAE